MDHETSTLYQNPDPAFQALSTQVTLLESDITGSESWDYAEALSAAMEHFTVADAPKPYLVSQAVRDYCKDLRVRKSMSAEVAARRTLDKHLAQFMRRDINTLTQAELGDWQADLVRGGDAETTRKSKATANHILASTKAALNLAYRRGKVAQRPWEFIQAYPAVDGCRDLLLTSEEVQSLLDVTTGAFHTLLKAAVLTGARLGELKNAKVQDLKDGRITLSGKCGPRNIPLRSDALEFFTNLVTGQPTDAPLLPSADGRAWKMGQRSRLMEKTVRASGVDSAAVFYSIRHFWLSSAVRDGLPILAVAQYAGTSVSMIEKHYGKFQPDNMQTMLNTVTL